MTADTPPIFVINLDREVARLRYIQTLFAQHGLTFERIEAVDASRIAELRESEIMPIRPSARFPRGLMRRDQINPNSHRKAALRILASGVPVGCVMEDDVNFGSSFPPLLRLLAAAPPADIVKLEGLGTVRHGVPVASFADRVLAAFAKPTMGAAAYLVTRRGAECIVKLTETVWGPYDHMLPEVVGQVSLLHLIPYPVHQRREAAIAYPDQSTVDSRRVSGFKRASREFQRYRQQLRAAINIFRRFPRQALSWKRMPLQEDGSR
jgi:glycosyl transferase family 25